MFCVLVFFVKMANETDIKKKRNRTENWLEEDKHLLIELIRERVSILENKSTDTYTNTRKLTAWKEVQNSFSALCKGTKRTLAQLKSQWAILKMEILKTGGGPPPKKDKENADGISAWLPNEFVTDTNEFDSDQINQNRVLESITNEAGVNEDMIVIHEIIEEISSNSQHVTKMNQSQDVTIDIENRQEVTPNRMSSAVKRQLAPCQTPSGKPGKKNNNNKTLTYAEKIAKNEIECRKELHEAQMQNEQKRARNLDLEELLLRKKIEYFEKKINNSFQ